jgi:HEAT repeats
MISKSVQIVIDHLRSDACSVDDLRAALKHSSAAVRANAIEALAAKDGDDDFIDELRQAAVDSANQVRLMGTISVGHVAVASLLRIGTEEAERAAHELINHWPEPDRHDLLWYLQSEGLLVAEPAASPDEGRR